MPSPATRESESLLRATIEATADGILVVDNSGQVTHFNARFARLWRIPDALLALGQDERLLAHVLDQLCDPQAFLSRVRDLYASAETDLDVLEFKDGRAFERYSCPLMQGRRIAGRVWSFRDLTERRRAEAERRSMEERMRQAQKMESLGMLAGGIAHDFNNLLTAILCNVDLALIEVSSAGRARHHLAEVVRAAQQAAGLCQQMLAYAGGSSLASKPVDLSQAVGDVAGIMEASVPRNAALACDLPSGLPAVRGDATQLSQVALNLVMNAAEALGGRPGRIGISTRLRECGQAELDAGALEEKLPAGPYVVLEVSDTGAGMDAATLARVFDPFFSTKFTGRGLGLAAVLGIVRSHHGTVRVTSEPGRGTCFCAYLPPCGPALTARGEAPQPGWSAQETGTVLLVDDEPAVRAVGRATLEQSGFCVVTASDGREAVDLFQSDPEGFSAVVLDLTMPVMDGEEAFRALREVRRDVPVILATGYAARDVARRFSGKGPSGFLQKPFRPSELSAELQRVLQAT